MLALVWAYFIGLNTYGEVLLLGICLGNSGTVFAALLAPHLAEKMGWNGVLGLALIPLVLTFLIYLVFAKDAPGRAPAQDFANYFRVLKEKDAWWFMLFYLVTFGGFVGLASSLVIYFNSQFGLSPVVAGYLTAGCVLVGSMFRPIGGLVADRIGGVRAL